MESDDAHVGLLEEDAQLVLGRRGRAVERDAHLLADPATERDNNA